MPRQYSKPSAQLQAELGEVADHARRLADFVNEFNALPDNFPRPKLLLITQSLQDLQFGTAEGCKEPLAYAQVVLANIRGTNILKESNFVDEDHDGVPPLARGHALDGHFKELMASVATALDAYRRESDNFDDEEAIVEPTIRRSEEDAALSNSYDRALMLKRSTSHFGNELFEIGTLTPDVDQLLRQNQDVRNLTDLVLAESKSDIIFTRWIKRLGIAYIPYPDLLKRGGSMIKKGTDIADILWSRWSELWTRIGHVLIHQIEEFGNDLISLAEHYEANSKIAGKLEPSALELDFERKVIETIILTRSKEVAHQAIVDYVSRWQDAQSVDFMRKVIRSAKSWFLVSHAIEHISKRISKNELSDELFGIVISLSPYDIAAPAAKQLYRTDNSKALEACKHIANVYHMGDKRAAELIRGFMLLMSVDEREVIRETNFDAVLRDVATFVHAPSKTIKQLRGETSSKRIYNTPSASEASRVRSEWLDNASDDDLQKKLMDPKTTQRERHIIASKLRGRKLR